MATQIFDILNKLLVQKDPNGKLIKIAFLEQDSGIILNNNMWAIFNNDKVIGENWDIDNIKMEFDNYKDLTDIAILTKIKNRFLKNKLDNKFINLLLVLRNLSF